jgi:GTPase SAR1 family protein
MSSKLDELPSASTPTPTAKPKPKPKPKPKEKSKPKEKTKAKDIWAKILDGDGAAGAAAARYVLFCGQRGAGKSELSALFVGGSSAAADVAADPTPTTALAYSHCARDGAGGASRVAHVWELGGGERLRPLLEIAMSAERVKAFTAVVVVDLSRPTEAIAAAIRWTDLLRRRERELGGTGVLRVENPCPIVLVANKYDRFRDEDSLKRKAVAQCLRSLAQQHSASVLMVARDEKELRRSFRYVVDHAVFGAEPKQRVAAADPSRALVVPLRLASTCDAVAPPPGTSAEDFGEHPRQRVEAWRDLVETYFPLPAGASRSPTRSLVGVGGGVGGGGDEAEALAASEAQERALHFGDAAVDRMRLQLEEQRVAYVRAQEQRKRLEASEKRGAKASKEKKARKGKSSRSGSTEGRGGDAAAAAAAAKKKKKKTREPSSKEGAEPSKE